MAGPLSIKLRCASWQQLSAIYKRDLARSAVFLRSNNPPPLGTEVRIDLTLPSDSMIVLNGVVGEHIPPGGLEGRGPGVDIKLNTVPQSALWLIETALASAQKNRSQAIPVAKESGQPAERPEPSRAASVPGDAGIEDGSDWAEAEDDLLAALGAEHESLRKLNPFQVLGVGYEAGDVDVRTAFAELTKRYHPDRFARYPSPELRRHAAEIFILIRDAYRRLGDEKGRTQALQQIGPRRAAPPPPPRAASVAGPVPTPPSPPPPSPGAGPPKPPPQTAAIPRMPAPPAPSPGGSGTPRPATPSPAPSAAPAPARATTVGTSRLPTINEDGTRTDYTAAENLLDQGKYDEALAVYKIYARKSPNDKMAKAGIELAEGLRALAQRDRMEAAQRFELVLEIDPSNERAARELAEMRRQATNERKGLLTRLLGKKE